MILINLDFFYIKPPPPNSPFLLLVLIKSVDCHDVEPGLGVLEHLLLVATQQPHAVVHGNQLV